MPPLSAFPWWSSSRSWLEPMIFTWFKWIINIFNDDWSWINRSWCFFLIFAAKKYWMMFGRLDNGTGGWDSRPIESFEWHFWKSFNKRNTKTNYSINNLSLTRIFVIDSCVCAREERKKIDFEIPRPPVYHSMMSIYDIQLKLSFLAFFLKMLFCFSVYSQLPHKINVWTDGQ